ncbi:DUF1515 family protein [Nitratireductor sp. OM-1]|uniref:DUF1515 family protein n=1 Tax=Nitratireductor sp. OM-1 TaxID=1756988 RepID=UPI002738AC2B|nr:DUF1515 family protein [Nitratireductor sp. OM-1]
MMRADDSRAVVHRWLDEMSERLSHVEGEVEATKKSVDQIQPVADDMVKLRTQAVGAGTVGRWLIRIGDRGGNARELDRCRLHLVDRASPH